ncbi:MAG: FliM/FliN family flagellar motor switch protein [Deltaproteobacteria bacterium]|nr:FliM/FliN family flagellar motor switch protein [Deltaproteobacteria bacterium]
MDQRRVQPFDYGLLPRFKRAELPWIRQIARSLQPWEGKPLNPLGDALTRVLGPWTAQFSGIFAGEREHLAQRWRDRPSVFVLYSMPQGEHAAVLRVDAPVARWMAARAFGASEAACEQSLAPAPWSAVHEGAFAVVCTALARTVAAGGPMALFRVATDSWSHVCDQLDAHQVIALEGTIEGPSVGACWTLLTSARAVTARPRALRTEGVTLLRRMGMLDVPVRLCAARQSIALAEVKSWAEGTVLLMDRGVALDADGTLAGTMELRAGALVCSVQVGGGRVVANAVPSSARAPMSTSSSPDDRTDPSVSPALLETLSCEVELIVARATFSVSEIAAWRPGEVIALGAPMGQPAELRVGGRLFAVGELCSVDGEIGLRITSLTDAG